MSENMHFDSEIRRITSRFQIVNDGDPVARDQFEESRHRPMRFPVTNGQAARELFEHPDYWPVEDLSIPD